MDGATRAFLVLASSAAFAYVLLGFWGCTALAAILAAMTADGFDLARDGWGLGAALSLATLEVLVSVIGIVSLNRQFVATERLARWVRVHLVPVPSDVTALVGGRRVLARLDVVDTPGLVSFTYGFLRPRIVLSRDLVEASTPEELAAVIEHEAYHARRLDPLKLTVARALPAAFFFLPVLGEFRDRYTVGRELAADRRAAARCGVGALAGALIKVTNAPAAFEPAAGAALGGGQLGARVEQLETGIEPPPTAVSRLGAAVTAMSIGAVAYLMVVSRSMIPGLGMHPHAPPMGDGTTLVSAVATTLCLSFWAWVAWRVFRWLAARAHVSY